MTISKLILTFAILLAGCANRPETIHASFVSFERYTGLNCSQLSGAMTSSRMELERYSRMQDSKANGDAWGMFLIGVPFSKLSGDHEGDVARLKGEVEAIQTAQIKTGCATIAGVAPNAPLQQTPTAPRPDPAQALQPALAPAAPTQPIAVKDWATAERYAKDNACNANPLVNLAARGPGFETYAITCTNGDVLMLRCEFGNCRALR